MRTAKWCLLLALLTAGLTGRLQGSELKELGVEATADGVRELLRRVAATPTSVARVHELLSQLESDDFLTRQRATAKLMRMPRQEIV